MSAYSAKKKLSFLTFLYFANKVSFDNIFLEVEVLLSVQPLCAVCYIYEQKLILIDSSFEATFSKKLLLYVLEVNDEVVAGGVVTLSYLCRTISFRFICTYNVYQDVVVVIFTL